MVSDILRGYTVASDSKALKIFTNVLWQKNTAREEVSQIS